MVAPETDLKKTYILYSNECTTKCVYHGWFWIVLLNYWVIEPIWRLKPRQWATKKIYKNASHIPESTDDISILYIAQQIRSVYVIGISEYDIYIYETTMRYVCFSIVNSSVATKLQINCKRQCDIMMGHQLCLQAQESRIFYFHCTRHIWDGRFLEWLFFRSGVIQISCKR